MKKLPMTAAAVSAMNSAPKSSVATSNSALESLRNSSDERAAANERFETLMKRCMKRESEFGSGGAFDAVTRPSLRTVDRPGLMDAEAAAKTELVRETIALDGTCTPACADPIEAAGDLSGSNLPSRWLAEDTPIGAEPDLNSDDGEKRIVMPPTFPGEA